jgi:hypothetical protein
MTTTRNGLRELGAKIKGLPIQDALRGRRQLMITTRVQVEQRKAELETGLEQLTALRLLQADQSLLAEAERKCLAAAKSKAQELRKLLAQTTQENNEVSAPLDAIKRAGKSLSDGIGAQWSEACQTYQARARALKPLAQQLNAKLLVCIEDLERLLGSYSTVPPTSPTAVQAIVAARAALDAEVAGMAMNGPVETFLRSAQNRCGDPKALFDDEILAYLNAHPALWKSLRVVLV